MHPDEITYDDNGVKIAKFMLDGKSYLLKQDLEGNCVLELPEIRCLKNDEIFMSAYFIGGIAAFAAEWQRSMQ